MKTKPHLTHRNCDRHAFERGNERFGLGDGALDLRQCEGGFVAGRVVPHLGHPNHVGVTRVFGHDVAKATGHPRRTFGENFDELVAFACHGSYFGDHSVHGTLLEMKKATATPTVVYAYREQHS